MFALHSDNPHFSPYDVNVDDVLEIWEAKSYISSTFPIADLSLERVASLVLDLQQQVAMLRKPSANSCELLCHCSPSATAEGLFAVGRG